MPLVIQYPHDARSPFGMEGLERLARSAGFGETSRLLHVGAGESGLHLASRMGCRVLMVDELPLPLEMLSEQVSARGLAGKVELKALPLSDAGAALELPDSAFDGAFVELRLPWKFGEAALWLRRLLVPSGRLAILYPVRVLSGASEAVDHWEKKLGEPLSTPMDMLDRLTQAGFETLAGEVLSNAELLTFYEGMETEDARLARLAAGTVSFMRLLGRRREPGEKPAPSRRGDR